MHDALQFTFRSIVCGTLVVGVLLFMSGTVFADKTSVSISAPASAAPGTEITIRVTATHSANNFLHHTNWLYVMVNGKEIARWNFSWREKPEESVFTREIKYTVRESVEITAEGHCNIHGSTGPQTVRVSVSDPSQ